MFGLSLTPFKESFLTQRHEGLRKMTAKVRNKRRDEKKKDCTPRGRERERERNKDTAEKIQSCGRELTYLMVSRQLESGLHPFNRDIIVDT